MTMRVKTAMNLSHRLITFASALPRMLILLLVSPLPSQGEVVYQNVSGWQPLPSVIEWEKSLLDAWAEVPDCRSDTGLCVNCGVGAIVVERLSDSHDEATEKLYREEGLLSHRAYSIGMDGGSPPWDYLDGDTVEIASYTKVITAFAMEVMLGEGKVRLDATIQEYLPECNWDSALSEEVGTITLDELRLQISGLPAQPPNRAETGSPGANPFGGYTIDMLCRSFVELPGLTTRGRFSYSNYGYGILGYLLTRAENASNPPSYEDLVRDKILLPLGMNNTVVVFDDTRAAIGCGRGLQRGEPSYRWGKYGVLQGNGALRSTLRDMGKFFTAMFLIGQRRVADWEHLAFIEDKEQFSPPPNLVSTFLDIFDDKGTFEACTCVSDWCEGWLCPQPNPVHEMINTGGATTYTSGLKFGFRKSGDTDGFSVMGSWGWDKRRAVFAVDTCGGCGSTNGASGSAVQRLVLLLADGPPTQTINTTPPANAGSPNGKCITRFTGFASSHAFPSNSYLKVEVREPGINGSPATVLVASSDGQGCTSPARAIDGGWALEKSVLYGCGWDPDPLANVEQRRNLLLKPDGSGAVLQEMGADIDLKYVVGDSRNSCSALL